jgi:hypothetical protein
MEFSYGSGVVEDAFNNPSGLGSYDFGGSDSGIFDSPVFDYDRTGEFDLPGLSGTGALRRRSRESDSMDRINKIFDALNKANTYKEQGSTRSSKIGGTPGTDIQQIGRSTYLVTPPPKKIPVGTQQPSGGSGLFGSIGGAAGALGTAAGVFGPLGAPIGALVGKGIDSIFG